MTSVSPTIVALATAPTAGAVGILRLSGPAALEVGRRLAPGIPAELTPRHAYLAAFVDAAGRALDEGLFLYFRGPASFTGEDVVELQAHGSPRLLQLLLARALEDGLARLATPGEFTRRAFLNGRIDLTRAEAVADLVAADSESAVRAAAAGLSGALSERVRALEEPLRALHADLEGVLNFPDEAEGADEDAGSRVQALRAQADALMAEAGHGRLVRRGARVALFGPVNAGKSTLFNRLVGEARALVDDEPGTTRDALEARVEWSGLGVTLFDTAGLRETPGRVEALGIARTRELLSGVDLAVLVLPPGTAEADAERWLAETGATPVLRVDGKCDVEARSSAMPEVRVVDARSDDSRSTSPGTPPRLRVSGLTGEGVDTLREALLSRLWGGGTPSAVALVSERHADALRRASEALSRAEAASRLSTLEVVSGEVALSLEALGEVSGTSASEALIDAIFQRFCIGK
ncbi:tRNA uridine-5-carboxymethylaminomethyl(34) synthesis GTPase MnmE [Myxococcus sp. XM-1-1-1]|uniref:tRNA uridine-5-carboxymethylaminomethyl(34) synthesis GTPase MnmE n=1 Tax=Myxococcus sp. XM-1-1-1 TaxID=2874602 RepID=UPI001CC1B6FE|nr:tRNA uridine-5-carboxymethylaminomethyl(34) synthesis GTPase MnmE [Myxococcus sp. XM-1-1-1]MBZ4411650.1 tRNA uridine-5-carboxymethylaminomethyl(34) synthesis GTPase MnmE [Myxococcus sp. XM-1-1-1]